MIVAGVLIQELSGCQERVLLDAVTPGQDRLLEGQVAIASDAKKAGNAG